MCRVRLSRLRNSTSRPSGGSNSTTVPTSPARISGAPELFSTATMSNSFSCRALVTSTIHLRVGRSENIAGDQAWHILAGSHDPGGTNHDRAIRTGVFEVDDVSAAVPVHCTDCRIAGCSSLTKSVDKQFSTFLTAPGDGAPLSSRSRIDSGRWSRRRRPPKNPPPELPARPYRRRSRRLARFRSKPGHGPAPMHDCAKSRVWGPSRDASGSSIASGEASRRRPGN